jgi:hypothetical protein
MKIGRVGIPNDTLGGKRALRKKGGGLNAPLAFHLN